MGSMKGKKGTVGRPPKLTAETTQKIASIIRLGASPEVAAAACDIPRETLVMWLRKGSAAKQGRYHVLVSTIHRAIAEFEAQSLMRINRAGGGVPTQYEKDAEGNVVRDAQGNPLVSVPGVKADWRAEAWRLERRLPKQWGARQEIALTGPDGAPLNATEMTDEQIRAKADEIAARIAGRAKSGG